MSTMQNFTPKDFETLNSIQLQLFLAGLAEVDSSWHGECINSVYSRLYYIIDGSFFIKIGDETFLLEKGNWYLLPYNTSYAYGTAGYAKHIYFHFNLSAVCEIDFFKAQGALMKLTCSPLVYQDMLNCIEQSGTTGQLKLRNLLYSILTDFMEAYNLSFAQSTYSDCILKATDYIKNNLRSTLTIADVAENIFVSKSNLTKHFRKELSMSVNEYINDLILLRCAHMLTTGNRSILSISEEFGFCDQFYFTRKFKAKFGKTPSRYRKTGMENI